MGDNVRFNLHTHTKRCNHAFGNEIEYVESAIENGIEILGFSDHAPYFFRDGYYSAFRMKREEISDYFETIRNLKKRYENKIQILIGMEAEYYPDHFDDFMNFIIPYNPDYLILGQHFTNNEYDGFYSGNPTDNVNILKQYVSQTIEAMNTGVFTYFAHPDLINFVGDETIYREEMKKICLCAKSLDIPLEINLLGIEENRSYPRKSFFKIASEIGNKAILGADAHRPENVFNRQAIFTAEDCAKELGIEIVDSVPLRAVVY